MKKKNPMLMNLISFVVLPFAIGVINLIKMRIFINYLGNEQNGIYQFYAQFFSYFTLIEAGLEMAVYSTLFKYLVNKEYDQVNAIIKGARVYWRRIGILCLIVGAVLLPIAPLMVRDAPSIWFVIFIQGMYSARISLSYFFAGPQAVAMADNRGYLIITIDSIGITLTSIGAIIIAFVSQNLLYIVSFELLAMLIFVAVKFHYVNSKFEWLNLKYKKQALFNFKSAMKGTSIIKITDMIVNNTDLTTVMLLLGSAASSGFSIYNNFALLLVMIFGTSLISTMQSFLGKKFADITVSESDKKSQVAILKGINFLVIVIIVPLITLTLNPFVGLFYGEEMVEGSLFYIVFITFIYFKLLRTPYSTLKVSLGNYNRFSKIAMINAVLNIILSVTFTYFWGLLGVLLGTTISYILTELWYEIKVMDLEFMEKKWIEIALQIIVHYAITMGISFGIYYAVGIYIHGYISLVLIALMTAVVLTIAVIGGVFSFSPTFRRNVKYILKSAKL